MTPRAKLTVFAALATALAALCLTPVLVTKGWISHALLVIAVVAAAGAGLRRAPLYRWAVPLLQLVVLFVLLLVGFAGPTALWGGVLPGPQSPDHLGEVLSTGFRDIGEYAIPAPPTAGLRLILVGSIGLVALVVDTVAVTYRRAALAGLPLLALYSVGTGLAGDDGSWLWFGLSAAGYLLLLFTEGQDRLTRWGRIFRGSAHGTESTGSISQSGQRVGVVALAIALLLPVFLPRLEGGLIDTGTSAGSGGSGGIGSTTTLDPLVSLAAAVAKSNDTELVAYRMDSASAATTYLRTGSLDEFTGSEWKLSSASSAVAYTDGISFPDPPEGMTELRSPRRITGDFAISPALESSWLPMPYPATRADVPGKWRVDGLTGTVMPDKGQSTRKLRYQVTGLEVRPSAEQLRTVRRADGTLADRYLKLPPGLPSVVQEKARAVTRGARTDYDKAMALQSWFTGPEFTYSTSVDPGNGNKAIEKFLQDRTGFCVHYASTMAAMARTLGIPSRVAVGFTPGRARGGDQYVVTGQMYHAWPELYFQGYGWLRFEPTPTRGVQPGYAEPVAAPTAAPSQQPSTAPAASSAAPQPTTSSSCDANLRRQGECGDERKAAGGSTDESLWVLSGQALATFGTVLAVLGLLLVPMLWRIRRRRRRLGTGGRRRSGGDGPPAPTDAQVLAAWDELIDSAWDLGIPPDESRTPRATARRIAESAELDEDAAAAAGRVALATERVLYSRPAGHASAGHASADHTQWSATPPAADVRLTRDALRARAGRAGRTRALLLPASSAQLWWGISDAVLGVRLAVGRGASRAAGAVTGPLRRVLRRRS
ncbi:transglutaminase family protein [Kitasatospora sp. NPDC054939]